MNESLVFTPDARSKDNLEQRGWSTRRQLLDPREYIASKGITAAANAALLLGKPLLLTGEPGCGKTEFAYKLAWDLGLKEPLRAEIKSTTESRDLLYQFDYLARLRDAQAGARRRAASAYLEFGPLGMAILSAHTDDCDVDWITDREWQRAKQKVGIGERAVVLIDEIDKAPRDVPNDLLTEVEELYFTVPEIERSPVIRANSARAPILIFTSNLEKQLPEPFLRRCVYFNIEFPEAQLLETIVVRRLMYYRQATALLKDAVEVFSAFRQRLVRAPGVAEFLDFVQILAAEGLPPDKGLRGNQEARPTVEKAVMVLAKNTQDQKLAPTVLNQWLGKEAAKESAPRSP